MRKNCIDRLKWVFIKNKESLSHSSFSAKCIKLTFSEIFNIS
ncbi:hypothetical protein PRO82_000840 [Candidatus Protochlamydia amoebophila]|nr:hypothetical protein [Candidatus Protochlamydia amoebophila]